jgi:hypothetical protein
MQEDFAKSLMLQPSLRGGVYRRQRRRPEGSVKSAVSFTEEIDPTGEDRERLRKGGATSTLFDDAEAGVRSRRPDKDSGDSVPSTLQLRLLGPRRA